MKTLILFLLITTFSFSQKKYKYDKWKVTELKAAKNYNAIRFLDSTEKEVLFYTNLVRINPKLFCETYLQEYIDINHLDCKNTYIASLIKMLHNSKPRGALVADAKIDEDIPSLGHRENLFNSNFTSVGISFKPHKTYGTNCVMDFGEDYSMLAKQ